LGDLCDDLDAGLADRRMRHMTDRLVAPMLPKQRDRQRELRAHRLDHIVHSVSRWRRRHAGDLTRVLVNLLDFKQAKSPIEHGDYLYLRGVGAAMTVPLGS